MISSWRSLGVATRGVILLVVVEIVAVLLLSAAGSAGERCRRQTTDANRRLVRELLLTDLALSTGTSYTRHPSQADLFAPHNEHPAAIEHFPAGSIIQPPAAPAVPPSPSERNGR